MPPYKIILVDDHQLFLDGLKLVLRDHDQIEVTDTANSGEELFEILEEKEVDLVTLDIHLPGIDGVEIAKRIKAEYPSVRIIVISMYSHVSQVKRLVSVGVNGFVLKEKGQKELLRALEIVMDGDFFYSAEVMQILSGSQPSKQRNGVHKVSLTKREVEVLQCVVEGLTTPQIAEKLFVATTTINTHRKNIMEKLGVKNVAELVRYATEAGLLS